MSSNLKEWCSSTKCSSEKINYTTFSYYYCKECKCELGDNLRQRVELMDKNGSNNKTNCGDGGEIDQYSMFDPSHWSGI